MTVTKNNNEIYLEEKIPNIQEHIAIINEVHDEISKLFPNVKNPDHFKKLTLNEFSVGLTSWISYTIGFNPTGINLDHADNVVSFKTKMKVLHQFFHINNKEEFEKYLPRKKMMDEEKEVSRLFLVSDYPNYLKTLNQSIEVDEKNLSDFNEYIKMNHYRHLTDIKFLFINTLQTKINPNFLYAYEISKLMLLVRLGYDLGFIEEKEVFEFQKEFYTIIKSQFDTWSSFHTNLLYGLLFSYLDVNRPMFIKEVLHQFLIYFDQINNQFSEVDFEIFNPDTGE
ncbi:DUF1266 domain-containing protein [Ureaplasma canigenitalium]|uniref:DUF1266 domain-containing protein n=1 Tax=Ureaplasma canigenitalium TaxID=42092 RepID=UPI0004E1E6FD|nr:DUF1266 domain-containing protein [Ureaplasma canigenitalium]